MAGNATPRPIPERLQTGPMTIPLPAPSGAFSTPGPDAERLTDDASPERLEAWRRKEIARLKEATGFDLFPDEGSMSGKEPTEFAGQSAGGKEVPGERRPR